ncbi:A-kinase anchor protein 13 isoform X1 [Channa argus]|uniref:A-kinase anchor protein 13 isoform X1 n=1 Tax=Channa argus TaxID=215402 RepID=UPI002946A107|nr:hypothetical protein Q8A73_005069 [Channa argus]
MKLNPQQAPLYGECVLTVQLDDEDVCHAAREDDEVEFYLLFLGSAQRHLSSTKRVSHNTLQAVCPAHNLCEQVLVTLCLDLHGAPVDTHSQETFCFVQDLALDMAHYLLENTAPEEALLLDDQLECERLDESLTLALKHLSLPHHRTAPQTDCQTDTITHKEDWTCTSTPLDKCSAESQSQQLSSLLHLAASRGLRTVGSFLLQQPGARVALRRTNAWGQTPACVAQSKGHEQLVELFTQYEASSDIQVEPKKHCYREGRVFEHHANLGTYTLTLPGRQQSVGGAKTDSREQCIIREEVEELRRLIQLHRDTQREPCTGTITVPQVGPACELLLCSNGQQESQWDAGLVVQTTEVQGSPPLIENTTHSAVVTHMSCTSGHLCQRLDAGEGKRSVPPTKSPAGRKKRNKKRTVKAKRHSTESAGNKTSNLESGRETAQTPTDSTGSAPKARGSVLPTKLVVASVITDGGATKIPATGETPLPIKPVSAPGGDGKCTSRKLVHTPTTNIIEKQEEENWEVAVPIYEHAVETESKKGDIQKPSARRDQFISTVEAAEHETVTMGQEQSQDHQESQLDPEKQSQPNSLNKTPQSGSRASPGSPDMKKKGRRGLWRDGGWIGSPMGSPPQRSDTAATSVWYQGENVNQGASEDSKRKEVNSQSIWYDGDKMDERKLAQLEQAECDLQGSDPGPPQLLKQALSSSQRHSALSQLHAAGAQPAQSHGPATQRQEVQGLQREKEIGPHWKEGGEEEVRNRETTVDIEERGEEKPGAEEKGAKGRKNRRKKGRRGVTEAKLSSISSNEYQSQSETPREQVTNLNPHSELESEAKDQTGRAHVQSPTVSEPSQQEEADNAMHLPSQTESQTRDTHGPDCAVGTSDSTHTTLTDQGKIDLTEATALQTIESKELSKDENVSAHEPDDFNMDFTAAASPLTDTDNRTADTVDITTVQPIEKEPLDFVEPELSDPALDQIASETVAKNERVTFVDWTGLVEYKFPEQLPITNLKPTEVTEDLFPVVFPEKTTQYVQFLDSNKPIQPEDLVERPKGICLSTEAAGLLCEGAKDFSPFQIQEGSTETTAKEYLEHCLVSEMLRDQPSKEEKRRELRVGEEEVGKESSWQGTNEEYEVVPGEDLSSTECGKKLELSSLDQENLQKYNEDLAITAVAVVTVAIASAMARIELSQGPADSLSANCPVYGQDPNGPSESIGQSSCEGQAYVKMSESEELQSITETDSPSLPRVHKEELETETKQDKVFTHPQSKEEEKLLQVDLESFPKTNSMNPAEVDSHGHMQMEIQLPSPVVDTGQHSQLPSLTLCPDSESEHSPNEQSVYQEESGAELLASHFRRGSSLSVEFLTAEGEGGGQAHRLDSVKSLESQAKQPEMGLLQTQCEWESHTLLLSCNPTLPATPHDSAPVADSSPEEPIAPVNVEFGKFQSSQLPVETKLVAAAFDNTSHKCVAVHEENELFDKDSDSLDTVDGWKHRERKTLKLEEEVRKDMITVEDTSHTEIEILATVDEESEDSTRDSNSTHTQQIQRGRDVGLPVQSCPQPATVTLCTDVHPIREECVSVCVLHRDGDSLEVSAKLDDSVFKKPNPPPSVGHRERKVCVSSDDASVQAEVFPGDGASSAGTADPVSPQSSRLSWKSETEDRGGGLTSAAGGGGGEEEEKKDQLLENPISSAILRASIRSLSPFRRHSWEPGRSSSATDTEITQRSSLKSLSGEVKRAKPPLHRRSMSWCPSNQCHPDQEQIDSRSYSLERLEVQRGGLQTPHSILSDREEMTSGRSLCLESQERGSLISLTEEEQEGEGLSIDSQTSCQVLSMKSSCPTMFHHQTLTKSISMVTISHRDLDGVSSFSSNASSLEYSISEEEPGPLRSETEGKGGPRISRTFSYLRSKMTKKGKEKERRGEKDRESKEREKKNPNGHVFVQVSPPPSATCQHCIKLLHNKETFLCNNCGLHVHKSCRESLFACSKIKAKQSLVPEAFPGSAGNMRSKSTSSGSSGSSTLPSSSREQWLTVTSPDDQLPVIFPRKSPSILNSHSNLAKSISTSNIAGLDDVPLKGLKFLSQSTDNLHQGSKVNASTESLTDEGTEMMDSQLMGEFECGIKDLEADSWSGTMDKKFLKTLKKDEIKRQDVIYELYQTEFHHVRTLKIMSEVYYKGLQREVQLDTQTLDKMFPVLDVLLDTHTHFLTRLLETKRTSQVEGKNNNSFLICHIGDILVNQFSDCSADRMKKVYGKFCSRHNEAVNLYKELHAKDKRFQAFIKKMMSSSIVRRLSIPECVLLVTQRITKYPVLIQRILQHTKESDEDHGLICKALRCVKELITAVDNKVNEQEKKRRLREVYSRTDSKSIMRMKSGQMFAKEDLIRGKKLLHDGALQLKNSAGRLKDVHALLLSDVLVFLQEKDQKYVFASLDQRSTVISLQNLIVREVANEERGLFLITAGTQSPEMVEVLASSKEERNTWRAIIQDAMHCMEKDEDEGVPSETEEDRRQQENKAKEIRELLRKKDEQIISLLEEKVHIFRELNDCNAASEDTNIPVREQMLFRATPDDVTKGEPIIKDALREVETLHALVNSGVGGASCSAVAVLTGGNVGPVCLPRRAETFGGFDSHQMNSSKNGEKEEGDESLDLRRTESDSVLKKGATASLQMLLKRSNEQVQHTVTHLHDLLILLQAVVVQQDSFIEDQRQALNDRLSANFSRHSSSSSISSSSSSRPSSVVEQEKHRSLERQRQEAASLQKQQAAYQEEKRRREREWEVKERDMEEREERLREEEEETRRRQQQLWEERETLQSKKEEFQREVERLKEAQRRLERDKETLRRDTDRLEGLRRDESEQLQRYQRTPSTTSDDSIKFHSSGSLDLDSKEAAEPPKEVEMSSSAPTKEPFLRIGSKRMSKNFNPFSSSCSSKSQGAEKESQLPSRLLQLAKPKEKKDKKKKKGKGGEPAQTEAKSTVMLDPQNDGDIFFC